MFTKNSLRLIFPPVFKTIINCCENFSTNYFTAFSIEAEPFICPIPAIHICVGTSKHVKHINFNGKITLEKLGLIGSMMKVIRCVQLVEWVSLFKGNLGWQGLMCRHDAPLSLIAISANSIQRSSGGKPHACASRPTNPLNLQILASSPLSKSVLVEVFIFSTDLVFSSGKIEPWFPGRVWCQ